MTDSSMSNYTPVKIRIEVTQPGTADDFSAAFTTSLMRAEAEAARLARAQFPGSTVLGSSFIAAHPHDPALAGRRVEVEVTITT